MSIPDDSDFASPAFKFVVEGKPLYIHTGLIARHSKPLDRMINGPMSEAQNEFAVLQDVDEKTFARFIRWAYTGTYCTAEFSVDKEAEPFPEADAIKKVAKKGKKKKHGWGEIHRDDDWGESPRDDGWDESPRDESPPQPYSQEHFKESFRIFKYAVDEAHVCPPLRSNKGPSENHTEVFLSHARVYVFAEKYDIQPLKILAVKRLHQTLAIFTLYPERAGDISKLLRYVYNNTAELQDGTEPLRALLTQYMGCEIAVLARDGEFQKALLEDGGAILGDFLKVVAGRVG